MRSILTAVAILFSILVAQAQITISNSTFIAAGDTLRIARAGNPEDVQAGPAGTNLNWDFTALYKDTALVVLVKDAASGNAASDFPTAEVFQDIGFGETYFNITSSAVTNLGFLTNGFAGVPVMITPKYNPPLVEKRAPMSYFDVNTSDASFLITFGTDIVPDTFFAGLPFKPDSIRVNQMIERLDVVDAWGSCSIPGGVYPVLRERRRSITETTIELKIFGLWVDLGSLGISFPGVGKDTTVAYHYFSADEKEAIAVVTVNPDDESETQTVQYKDNGISSTIQPEPLGQVLFQGPQPATQLVRFDLSPLRHPADLVIMNHQGQVVLTRAAQSGWIDIAVDQLIPGMYVYQIREEGRLRESGQVIIQH
ncbi:MAG: T9SS type A sorting domain-containing protein [Saprospiraceae bacterium]